jgi:putative phosphoribosyl transferase
MSDSPYFKNRVQAGKLLARQLAAWAHHPEAIVLALPRGGVPVGFAIAKTLGIDLDVLLVRKLGVPRHEEYAMGAVGSGGVRVLQEDVVAWEGVPAEAIEAVTARELREIERRDRLYRGGRAPLELGGRVAILVDDGLATGATMRAAVAVARQHGPARIIVALPVGQPDSCAALATEVDELVCLCMPPRFHAVSQWYKEFDQTSDEEVQDLLAIAWRAQSLRQSAIHE